MRIKLVCIATNKYTQYIPQFIESASKYFFPDDELVIDIFTDSPDKVVMWRFYSSRVQITDIEIPSYKFPEATMLRYHIFTENASYLLGSDLVFYADIDSKFVDYVGKDDELAEYIRETRYSKLFCTRHPGFWDKQSGSWEDRRESLCYVDSTSRAPFYVAGGFLGGSTTEFLNLSGVCSELIRGDLRNGLTPRWHDESAYNKYISCINKNVSFLSPAYVYPEEKPDWFTWTGTPKILALKKNHEEMRS